MKLIISPAKKMNEEEILEWREYPIFLERTERILSFFRGLTYTEMKSLWKCNDQIAHQNMERLAEMDLRRNLSPAILAYEGIQYKYMAPGVLEKSSLEWLQEHLRILSGFYGILKPMDGIVPYRLEMQAKAGIEGFRDLYAFWGESLYRELTGEDSVILNLASKEYSRCISDHLRKNDRFITCTFAEMNQGKLIQKGTLAKMARGEMVRFLAENQAEKPEDAKKFDRLGFEYHEELSSEKNYVFVKKESMSITE